MMHPTPTMDLALQHILQSGLAVVRDQPVDDARRAKVLPALVQIFDDAKRGSQAHGGHMLLAAVQEQPAFERFALFFRYLDRTFGQDLPARLSEASFVLSTIEQHGNLAADAKVRVAQLLEDLLLAIERENALTQLPSPKEVRLSF